jgi:hypothetical protein
MSLTINAQIDRVEPPFWYAGMHELEILFYGKNIAQYKSRLQVPLPSPT